MEQTIGKAAVLDYIRLDVTADEMELVLAALHLLLIVEDDHKTIPQLKTLLARLETPAVATAH